MPGIRAQEKILVKFFLGPWVDFLVAKVTAKLTQNGQLIDSEKEKPQFVNYYNSFLNDGRLHGMSLALICSPRRQVQSRTRKLTVTRHSKREVVRTEQRVGRAKSAAENYWSLKRIMVYGALSSILEARMPPLPPVPMIGLAYDMESYRLRATCEQGDNELNLYNISNGNRRTTSLQHPKFAGLTFRLNKAGLKGGLERGVVPATHRAIDFVVTPSRTPTNCRGVEDAEVGAMQSDRTLWRMRRLLGGVTLLGPWIYALYLLGQVARGMISNDSCICWRDR
ncbi:hypothetical protein C8R45DRAFT_1176470 [Mycena sanguinolenta]|nr:hypothetical protein C8R45DRAFT_1176470 [Mycena sanguinolenta]